MNSQERLLISQLFERLRSAANAPRDPEADAFIRQQLAAQPHAAYAMAQTIIVQNQALDAAQQRIAELESQQRGGAGYGDDRNRAAGFGGGDRYGQDRYGEERPMGAPDLGRGSVPPSGPWAHQQQQAPSGPWQGQPQQQPQPSRGGGFLSGALQTAAGVAGGVLLGNALGGMFGGGSSAKASENNAAADDKGNDDGDTSDASDNSSDGDGGGWFSDLFGGGDDSGGGDDGDWS
jgi:hypothetical protein